MCSIKQPTTITEQFSETVHVHRHVSQCSIKQPTTTTEQFSETVHVHQHVSHSIQISTHHHNLMKKTVGTAKIKHVQLTKKCSWAGKGSIQLLHINCYFSDNMCGWGYDHSLIDSWKMRRETTVTVPVQVATFDAQQKCVKQLWRLQGALHNLMLCIEQQVLQSCS